MQKPIRLYQRYPMDLDGLTYVSSNETPIGRIKVLSFGGMLVTPTNSSLRLAVNNRWAIPSEVDVHLFGKKFSAEVEVRSLPSREIGYRFTHQESELLPFLKSILEPLEWGQALNQGANTSDSEQALTVPTRIQWLGTDEEGVLNFSFTFWNGKLEYQLVKQGGEITSFHNVGPGAILSNMHMTPKLDQNILRTTVAFFTGLADGKKYSPYSRVLEWLSAHSGLIQYITLPNI